MPTPLWVPVVRLFLSDNDKRNLIDIASHRIQYYFCGPTKFSVYDMQSQGRQISLLDSPNGS